MKAEYDFSKGERGKFYDPSAVFSLPVSEEQIDEIVIAEAEDDIAWEEPVLVHRDILTVIPLPPEQPGEKSRIGG